MQAAALLRRNKRDGGPNYEGAIYAVVFFEKTDNDLSSQLDALAKAYPMFTISWCPVEGELVPISTPAWKVVKT